MIAFPNAKINLGLNVIEKRTDGYHNIESCFFPIPLYDALEIIESDTFSFHTYGLNIPGSEGSNLCIKAYEVLKQDHNLPPVAIHLLKKIPMGAGLGGGSADGAFSLVLINQLFELGIDIPTLEKYALELGSDCPFFVENTTAIAEGKGEVLESFRLDLKGYFIAVQPSEIHITTKEAYGGVTPQKAESGILKILSKPMTEWRDLLINDFEASIFMDHPELAQTKEAMYDAGAVYASMTGSGSSVYGLFEERPKNSDWLIMEL